MIAAAVTTILAGALGYEIVSTGPVRGAMRTLSELFTLANRPDLSDEARLAAAERLCTAEYVRAHPLELAPQGGIKGLPRNIDKNFKAWREGPHVWICPTKRSNRAGPVYQFVYRHDRWLFDGPIAILRPWGEVIRTSESADFPVD
jgi:hypothetical protein